MDVISLAWNRAETNRLNSSQNKRSQETQACLISSHCLIFSQKKSQKSALYQPFLPTFSSLKDSVPPGEAKKEAERIPHWTTAKITTISSLAAEEWMAWVQMWARGRRWHSLLQALPVACKKGWAGETLGKICRWRKLSNATTAGRNATCEKQNS